ncbi:MAG: hypothetical protein KDD76_01380 [Rickettsiales bacterium]|nr:hypothetical protein [Rickettsiales bacterium]
MIRPLTICWLMMVVVLAYSVFQVEFRVEGLRAELSEMERQLVQERQSIHVLQAEWAFLTAPDRLNKMASSQLETEDMVLDQIARIEDIPLRPGVVARSSTPSDGVTKVDVALSSANGRVQ